jgi:hypothetical protein
LLRERGRGVPLPRPSDAGRNDQGSPAELTPLPLGSPAERRCLHPIRPVRDSADDSSPRRRHCSAECGHVICVRKKVSYRSPRTISVQSSRLPGREMSDGGEIRRFLYKRERKDPSVMRIAYLRIEGQARYRLCVNRLSPIGKKASEIGTDRERLP